MMTRYFIWMFSLLLFNFSCSERKISDNEKNQALQDYTACTQIADQWLFKLDSSDYNYLLNLQLAKEINKDSGLIYINNVQNEYGKIKSRRFIGAHMWTGKKLLTYAPDIEDNFLIRTHMVRSEDGFYIVDPKYFGLTSSAQMFAGFPKGRYIMMMYRSVATNKPYAEEAVILGYNSAGYWEVFTYKISDDL